MKRSEAPVVQMYWITAAGGLAPVEVRYCQIDGKFYAEVEFTIVDEESESGFSKRTQLFSPEDERLVDRDEAVNYISPSEAFDYSGGNS